MTKTPEETASPPLSPEDVRFVIDLLVEAGDIAVHMREGITIETKSRADDLVTSADKALSDLIIKRLSERFPADLVLSEESPWQGEPTEKRRWLIDPIDGTKYYVDNSGNYCVMVGLLEGTKQVFGGFYMPVQGIALAGGVGISAVSFDKKSGTLTTIDETFPALDQGSQTGAGPEAATKAKLRVLVSDNDLKANPWVKELPEVEIRRGTSIGIDVWELRAGLADVFVHIRPTLKYWDTAAPGCVASALGMDVGTELGDEITFAYTDPTHQQTIVIGRKGALAWWRQVWNSKN